MAYACPSCEAPASVAVLFGEEGSYPYPCVRCAWVPGWMPDRLEQRANVPCPTRGCDGSVCEVYVFGVRGGSAALGQVRREPCGQCYGGVRGARPARRPAVRS